MSKYESDSPSVQETVELNFLSSKRTVFVVLHISRSRNSQARDFISVQCIKHTLESAQNFVDSHPLYDRDYWQIEECDLEN